MFTTDSAIQSDEERNRIYLRHQELLEDCLTLLEKLNTAGLSSAFSLASIIKLKEQILEDELQLIALNVLAEERVDYYLKLHDRMADALLQVRESSAI